MLNVPIDFTIHGMISSPHFRDMRPYAIISKWILEANAWYISPTIRWFAQVGPAIPAARLGLLSLLCHPGGTVAGGGDGTITLFNESGRDCAQTELPGGVVAMSFSPDHKEVRKPN